MSQSSKLFPEGRRPLGKETFSFRCHQDIGCFTRCCRKLELYLYPYDVIRLKNALGLASGEFLERHTGVVKGQNPFFPAVILRMRKDEENTCPFLENSGCTVYEDRPSACRTYPLERAVDRATTSGRPDEYYFLLRHDYCLGHEEDRELTVAEWVRDQRLLTYNMMDDLWAEVDTLFAGNPWQGEGAAGPLQQMAFMACYNIDTFRRYAIDQGIFDRFRMSKSERRALETDDEALLRFAFKWLLFYLGGKPTLKERRRR